MNNCPVCKREYTLLSFIGDILTINFNDTCNECLKKIREKEREKWMKIKYYKENKNGT